MDDAVLLYVGAVFIGLASVAVFARRGGAAGVGVGVFLFLCAASVAGLVAPFAGFSSTANASTLFGASIGLFLVGSLLSEGFLRGLHRVLFLSFGRIISIFLLSTVIPFGTLETASRLGTDVGALHYFAPMQTVSPHKSEDWRNFHITADEFRESDPVLLWKPVPRAPYTEQRFKGELAEIPKPKNVFRIMTYGDSNTDGPPSGGWPERLEDALERNKKDKESGLRYEVLNAGVAGYSSYQGFLRFKGDVDTYTPDLITVSFGWNDLPDAGGRPDKEYKPPSPVIADLLRTLLRFRFYLTFKYYFAKLFAQSDAAPREAGPRVSLDDYRSTMEGFLREASARGIKIVFLTRPHKLSREAIRQESTWRRSVPDYNDAIVEFGKKNHAPVFDAERYFEAQDNALFGDECHFIQEGHDKMGKALAEFMRAEGVVPN